MMRYTVVHKDTGDYLTKCHQDVSRKPDSEDPIWHPTLKGLIGELDDFVDRGCSRSILEFDEGGELAEYRIVREYIEHKELEQGDIATLAGIRCEVDEDDDDE